MWQDLSEVLNYDNAMWVIFGDFNEVRFNSERKNTEFIEKRAEAFSDFIKANSLIDLPLGVHLYTRISDNGLQFNKLDRFLVSENFIHQWPNIHAMVLDKKHSDHCPLILKDGNIDFGLKPIKVFDEWINHKDARDVIRKIWEKKVSSWKPDCIFRDRLKNTKIELRNWFAISHCKLKAEIEDLSKVVSEWIWSTSPSYIKNDAHSFFKKLYTKNNEDSFELNSWNGFTIDHLVAKQLEFKFNESEVFEAIKSCGKNKAPGPDGFNLLFYSKYWDIIKDDLMCALNWFWESETISNGCNATFIALIPKVKDPLNFSNYRPISLINSYYKILSKILANGIKKLILRLIGVEQTAF
ncbi:uncharacterized protein [Rutidosis leptorrhynchoides]|uniref:uncharacterized protein n=1 Tax=Rutidosis leptorrhynchoides TaxID=125765 RepID=UPI003A993523